MKKISYGQLLTDYGMETSVDDMFYRASDVDALFDDVRRLVEAARKIYHDATWSKIKPPGWMYEELKEAIAAVERHLLKE